MTVKELFEKYRGKTEDNEYICRGHCVTLDPATYDELSGFRELCKEYGVDKQVVDEHEEFYSQTNSLFNYFICNDRALFDWWEDADQRAIWLGCIDDESDDFHGHIISRVKMLLS